MGFLGRKLKHSEHNGSTQGCERTPMACFSPSPPQPIIHRLHHLFLLFSFIDALRRALCDQDPGVMAASLNIFHDMSIANPATFKDLTSSFVNILKQVIEGRLPRDFEYHKIPAPWIQLKLLRILAILGSDDQAYVDWDRRKHLVIRYE